MNADNYHFCRDYELISTLVETSTGVLVRTALNDLKQVPEVIEKETGLSNAALNNFDTRSGL